MKSFKKYFLTICATTYSGVFFLRIFHYGFIYEKPIQIITGCVPTVIITFFLIVFFSIFQRNLIEYFYDDRKSNRGIQIAFGNFKVKTLCHKRQAYHQQKAQTQHNHSGVLFDKSG